MSIEKIISGMPKDLLDSFELGDFLSVKAPDELIKNAFLHDMDDNPIDCNIYHPKYGYPGFTTSEKGTILTSFNPTIYKEVGGGRYVYCIQNYNLTCIHEDGHLTNKDGVQVQFVDHIILNRTRMAESIEDFEEIYKREFDLANIPQDQSSFILLASKLLEHINLCKDNYENHRTFIGPKDRRTGDMSLILTANKFIRFLNTLLEPNAVDQFGFLQNLKVSDQGSQKVYLKSIESTNLFDKNSSGPNGKSYISSISSNYDYDYYYDLTKHLSDDFVHETIEYFTSGPRNGTFEPLEFLNLWHPHLEYFDSHMDRPISLIKRIKSLFLSDEHKHLLFGFILKFYGGYPIQKGNYQSSFSLRLIEDAFLEYPYDSIDKKYCLNKQQPDYVPPAYIPCAENYKYYLSDFAEISHDYDLDFYHKVANISNQDLVFDTIWYFSRGPRKGLFEPSGFLNLLWKQSNFIHKNLYGKAKSTFDALNSLPLDDLQKHILFGFILKWKGGIPIEGVDADQKIFYRLLEREFLKYDEETPEKYFCSKSCWIEFRESGNSSLTYPNNYNIESSPREFPSDSSSKWTNNFNSCTDYQEIRSHFQDLTRLRSGNGEPHITEMQLSEFLDAAFCNRSIVRKIKMNYQRGEIKKIRSIFYNFYRKSWQHYESSRNVKDKYVRLLTDFFENFEYQSNFGNFNKP